MTRFMELRTRVAEEVDLDDEELRRRLEESEPLAQMIAEVVRGTVESDLEAKRRLLARAAIRALQDDAAVDEEAAFVRTANAIDTTAVRVLAILGEGRRDAEGRSLPTQFIPLSEAFPLARSPAGHRLRHVVARRGRLGRDTSLGERHPRQ